MTESQLEQQVDERQFAGRLQTHAEVFFRLSNALLATKDSSWNKKHYFQLISEADALESFLDDYGARYNETYSFLVELVASLRGFAQAGYSLTHLAGRLDSYGASGWLSSDELEGGRASLLRAKEFLRRSLATMLEETHAEAHRLGLEITPEEFPESNFLPVAARRRLPRNLGQTHLSDEEQKIAEVVTKYLQACEMLGGLGIHPIEEAEERRVFLASTCKEEHARVYEATVHNLQSTYDTHIQNTVLESKDPRLSLLRGHVSAALHLLEAVTYLTHFIERHEDEIRSEEAKQRISQLVDGSAVQDVILNELLVWADRYLQSGARVADALLPEYTNLQELEVELLDGLKLHARPASLVVNIVNQHGTPVEMVLGGQSCNAGSILELLIAVGSHPDERLFTFRGDVRPLRDIRLLFESGLGEDGLDGLPAELDYLKNRER